MVRRFKIKIEGKIYEVEVEEITDGYEISKREEVEKSTKFVEDVKTEKKEKASLRKEKEKTKPKDEVSTQSKVEESEKTDKNLKFVTAPMSGIIVSVEVEEGMAVSPGQVLLILEAMKMENSIISEYNGVVKEVFVKKGDNVEVGQKLLTIG